METAAADTTPDGLGVHFDSKTDPNSPWQIFCNRIGREGRVFTKDPNAVTCEACRIKLLSSGGIRPIVGAGATEIMFTDRHPYTVIAVSESGKTVTLQADKATRTDNNGMSESQTYRYEANPDGEKVTARLTKRGWKSNGRSFVIGYRNEYHDFSF